MREFRNRKLTQSFKDAFRGIWLCIRSERNMRIHLVVTAYLLFFAPFLKVSRAEYAMLLTVIGIMITAESFNTAIEKLCDYTCSHKDRRIGFVKDISAGAVLVSALTAVCIGFLLLFKPAELLLLFNTIISNLLYIALLVSSIVLSVIFIIIGPLGIKKWFHTNKKQKRKMRKK